MIALLRQMLAFVLLAGFYILATWLAYVSLRVAIKWSKDAIYFGLIEPRLGFAVPSGLAAICAASVFLALLRGIFAASAPARRAAQEAVWVHPKDAPNLWSTVIDLAGRIGTPVPTELWLTAEANASVSEDTWRLGSEVGVRRMYIGVPLLVGLTTDELRAVLCHELGHYAGRHTRFSAIAHRGSVALASTRERVAFSRGRSGPLFWWPWLCCGLLWGYACVYDCVTLSIRRRHEIDADAAAARVMGKEVTEEALRAVHVVAAAWNDFRIRFLDVSHHAGLNPDDPFEAFKDMLADARYYQKALDCHGRRMPEQSRSIFDSHPRLGRRLAKLERKVVAFGTGNHPPVVDLSGELEIHMRRVWDVRVRAEETCPWANWLSKIVEYRAIEPARKLKVAVDRINVRQSAFCPGLRLSDVFDLIDKGRGVQLSATLADSLGILPTYSSRAKETFRDTVRELIELSLVQAKGASWKHDWTLGRRLVLGDDVTEVELRDLIRMNIEMCDEVYMRQPDAIIRMSALSRLRLRLAKLGIDEQRYFVV